MCRCAACARRLTIERLISVILVTGAAGLIGGAVVQALANAGHRVVGLVHRNPQIVGNDGRQVPVRPLDAGVAEPGMVFALRGNIEADNLGLDQSAFAWLQANITVVVHCAALVRFEANLADLHAVNVRGTQNVATLFPCARFIHVSTAYVCGLTDGSIAETDCNTMGAFGNGYEQSKALGEAALRKLRPEACIVRPSIVVGEASTGRIRDFDTIYRAFKFIAEGRIKQVPVAPYATLNFVPIDHVVDSTCYLASNQVRDEDVWGKTLHLSARAAVPATRFLSLIGQVSGLVAPKVTLPNERQGAAGLSERLVQPYWGYFRRNPEFETTVAAKLLGRQAPLMGDTELLRQIEYCVEAGFIRRSTHALMRDDHYRTSGY